jgi:hypothetical protein
VQDDYRRIAQAAAPPEWIVRKMSELIEGKCVGTRVLEKLDATETRINGTVETIDAGVSLKATLEIAEIAGYVPSKRPQIPWTRSRTCSRCRTRSSRR